MAESDCIDETATNGGIWLDDIGRSCIYYEKFTHECNNSLYLNSNLSHACCICSAGRNASALYSNSTTLCEPEYNPVWAIVVVAFLLLILCILFVSFYFICHLYRNEKRQNKRLLQYKARRSELPRQGSNKSEASKTVLEAEDEYAAIPGDIGIGKKPNRRMTADNDDADDWERDRPRRHSPTGSHAVQFKLRTSFRSNRERGASTQSTRSATTHRGESSTSISVLNKGKSSGHVFAAPAVGGNQSGHNTPLMSGDEDHGPDVVADAAYDEYAAIDPSAMNNHSNYRHHVISNTTAATNTNANTNTISTPISQHHAHQSIIEATSKSKSNPQTIPLKKSRSKSPVASSSKHREEFPFHQTTQRRYSEELEFNNHAQRKRHSSRFSNFNKNLESFGHNKHQTQDDMIFLSMDTYLSDDDEALTPMHEIEEPDEHDDDDDDDDAEEEEEQKDTDKNRKPERNSNINIKITINDDEHKANFSSMHRATSSRRMATKADFTRISTKRVIKLFAPQEIKYSDIDFSDNVEIGKGSFGKVVKAKYHEIDVAVKTLHRQKLTSAELLNFKREAAIMQKVGGHKHIARMYGFCTKPQICIVSEYYERGSLHDLIKQSQSKDGTKISSDLRIQMSIEASLGIHHLHQQQVIHRDVSARNLLVDKNWTVVVADLGMSTLKSKIKQNQKKQSSQPVPVKWMAPESIIGHEYSEKTDSYSFGITLYEIFSESEPYPGLLPLEAGAKVVHEGLRPSIDKNKKIRNIPNLQKLLKMLWKTQPKDRPDFYFISQSLKKIKKQWNSLRHTGNKKDLYIVQ